MKDVTPIMLVRACTENTSVLTSTLGWFDSERELVMSRLADEKELDEIYKLQGEARCIRRLRAMIAQMTKAKGQVDDEQRNGRARS